MGYEESRLPEALSRREGILQDKLEHVEACDVMGEC
jgi:hypothetical protein